MPGIILILGHTNNQQGKLSPIAQQRCEQGLQEYRKHPSRKILFTGAFGSHFNTTKIHHAEYLQQYLLRRSIPQKAILGLVPSSNTVEDAWCSKKMIDQSRIRGVTVVTSNFHRERVQYIFKHIFRGYELHFSFSKTSCTSATWKKLVAHEKASLQRLQQTGLLSLIPPKQTL